MVREGQDDSGRNNDVVRLAEMIGHMCGAIRELTSNNMEERERRALAEEAMATADDARNTVEQELGRQYERNVLIEARLAEWEVPPVCDCGSPSYVVYCRRCGKPLK